ncbi:MAG: M20 family metallopeptidase [Phycisphaerae bacterium]
MSHGLEQIIEQVLPAATALRHDLHAHPELSFEEHATARRIVERLEPLGNLEIRTGIAGTGVVATLNAGRSGRCVALRAELDALPIEEENDVAYKSTHAGKMHACGHDGHMSCLVGAATVLSQVADALPGIVKFIFQPAEEGGGGGRRMIEAGVLEEPKVDAIFALHGWPLMPLGTVGVRPGPSLASTNPWRITVRGVGSHAAYPHKGIDPIVAAAHVVTALQTIASRSTNPLESVVVTVGQFLAGTAENIIPRTARLVGTLRTLDPQVREKAVSLIKQIATATASAFGAEAECDIREGYPVLINDAAMAGFVERVARDVVGADHVDGNVAPSMGGEDFAYYAEQIPAAFWRLGVRSGDPASQPGLHQPTYDFPDAAIAHGIRMHCELARRFLSDA